MGTNTMKICAVAGCDRQPKARGWCSLHYGRWQNHGTTEALRVRTDIAHQLTDAQHAERLALYRSGLNDAAIAERVGVTKGTVTSWRNRNRLPTHSPMRGPKREERFTIRMELWKQGLSETEIAEALGENRKTIAEWRLRQGLESRAPKLVLEKHGCWTGDGASYGAVHQRLRSQRGRADVFDCEWCGEPAKHWAYDYACPNAKTSEHGTYTTDLDHYQPLCVLCHIRGDAAYRKALKRREAS